MINFSEVLVSEALKPSFARDEIVRRLAAVIIDGQLPAGTPIRQQWLANHYSVSRMPAREALRQLESQGLLVNKEHRGMRVATVKPSAQDLQAERDALHLRCNAADQRADELFSLLVQALPLLVNSPTQVQQDTEELVAKIEAAIACRPLSLGSLAPQGLCLSEPEHGLILKRFSAIL